MKAPMDEVDVVAAVVPVRACVSVCVCVCVCTCVCGVWRDGGTAHITDPH